MMRLFVLGHVPFELDGVGPRKRIDLEAAGQPQRGVGDVALIGVDARAGIGSAIFTPSISVSHTEVRCPAPLMTPFGAPSCVDHHALAGQEVARQRQRPPRGVDQRRIAVDVDVRRVDAVLGREPPVALDDLVLAVGIDRKIVVEEAGLQVERESDAASASPMKTNTRFLCSSTG